MIRHAVRVSVPVIAHRSCSRTLYLGGDGPIQEAYQVLDLPPTANAEEIAQVRTRIYPV
jgi:hypothetical protein